MIARLWIFGIAAVGFCSILLATVQGVGITPDAVAYLQASVNLAEGVGFAGENYCGGSAAPITHWPPFFPALLAAGVDSGVPPMTGARWLNAILFAANLALAGFIIRKHTNASLLFPVLGCLFLLSAFPMLETHSAAWTEPLFFFLGVSGLYALGCYLQRGNLILLLLAGSAIGMSILTRYAGIALVITGCFAVAFLGRRSLQKKIADSFIFATFSLLPFLLFLLRNYRISGDLANRKLEYNPAIFSHIDALVTSFASWLLPGVDRFEFLPAQPVVVPLLFVLALSLWIVLVMRLSGPGSYKSANENQGLENHSSLYVFLLFIFFYIAMLLFSALFSSAPPPVDNRLLSPVMIPIVILAVCGLHRFFISLQSRLLQISTAIIAIMMSSVYLVAGGTLVYYLFENGRGYTGRSWQYEAMDVKLNTLPENAVVFSNQPGFITFAFKRCVHNLARPPDKALSVLNNAAAGLAPQVSVFVIYFDQARQFTPRKEGAQGLQDLTHRELRDAMAKLDPKLVLHERNAFLYEIAKKPEVETSIGG